MKSHEVDKPLMFLLGVLLLFVVAGACRSSGKKRQPSNTTASQGSRSSRDGNGASQLTISEWKGEIQGQVYNQSFRLPVSISITEPLPDESNRVRLNMNAGNPSQIGHLALTSSLQLNTPYTGRQVTLQYCSIELQGAQLKAVLTNEHKGEGAVYNSFIAPNVSAESAPEGPGREVYKAMGPTEMFAFHQGAIVTMNLNGNELSGEVLGKGYSAAGIFATPDVVYRGKFTATDAR